MGFFFSDDTKVLFAGIQGKNKGMPISHHEKTFASVPSSSMQDDKKIGEILHI